MSRDIENKIVSMEFDNSKFEKPAEQSISTLDKLKSALQFKNVEQGFNAMNTAIKKVTFEPLSKGIDSVYAKFTLLERFTIQLYDRLSNKIIDMGLQLGRSLFTTPRKTGMSEYEEKMGAIQVMVNSTGKDLNYINGKLEELNKYADQTIYSFSDMTNNIGKFTNAGVDLDVAVDAIKGISNVAAVAGATSAQASRAMYNFSQALGMGSVRLQDWMSIENANMATVEFKQALIDMGLQLGQLRKDESGVIRDTKGTIVTMENFRNSLSNGWLSTDVLTKTLARFSDETDKLGKKAYQAATEVKTFSMLIDTLKEALQSGWSQSWEYIIGDFNQAKQLWTDVSNVLGGVIGRMADARNTMLKFWSEMGGRTSLLNAFSNLWKNLTSILGAVRDAFRTVFPPMTGEKLVKMTRGFEQLTKKMKPSMVTIDRLRHIFVGFFNAVGIVIDAVKALKRSFSTVFKNSLVEASDSILKMTANFGDWVTKLRSSIQESKVFERVFTGLAKAVKFVTDIFAKVFKQLTTIINAFRTGGIEAGFKAIKDAFVNMVNSIWAYIKSKKPIEAIKRLGVKIANAIEEWPVTRGIKNALLKIWDFLKNNPITQFVVGLFEGLVVSVKAAIDKFSGISVKPVGNLIDKMREKLKPLEAVKNFFSKIFGGIITVFKKIAPIFRKVGDYLGKTIGMVFKTLGGIINRSDLGDIGALIAGVGVYKGSTKLGSGVGSFFSSLTAPLKSIADIGKKVSGLIGEITKTFKSVQTALDARALFDIAKAIALLAAALVILSTIPKDELTKATAIIIELFAALALTLKSLSKNQAEGVKGAASLTSMSATMVALGAAVLLIAGAVAVLSLISYENLIKGLFGISIVLAAISTFIKSLSKKKASVLSAIPILSMVPLVTAIASSLLILTIASKIDKDGLLKSIAAMSAVLLAIGGLYAIISKTTKWKTIASTFPIAAITALLLSISVSLFALTLAAKIDPDGLRNSIFGMIIAIAAIAAFYVVIQKNTRLLKSPMALFPLIGIIGMLVSIAISLSLLTVVSRRDPTSLANGVGAMVKAIAAITVSYVILNKMTSNLAFLKVAPILAFVNAIIIVTAALAGLTLIAGKKPEALKNALIGMGSVMLGLVALCAIVSKFNLTRGIRVAPIIAMATAVALLAVPLAIMIRSFKKDDEVVNAETSFALLDNFAYILAGLGAVYIAIKVVSNKVKVREVLKAVAGVGLLSLLLGATITLLSKMEKVDVSSIGKLVLLLGSLTAVALLASAMTSFEPVKKGLSVLSKSFMLFAGGVAILTAAVSLFLLVLKRLSTMSSDEIDSVGKSIGSLADVIAEQKDKIANAIGGVVATIFKTILSIIRQSLDVVLKDVFGMLLDTLDSLIENAPVLISKIVSLLLEILDGISKNAGVLIEKLVSTLISIIKALADAIRKHGSEIIDAVLDLVKQVIALVSNAISKIFGFSEEKVRSVITIITKVAVPLALIFGLLSKIGHLVGTVIITVVSAGRAAISIISGIPGILSSVLSGLKVIGSAAIAHPILALFAAIAAVATTAGIKALNSVKTITDADKEVTEATKAVREEEEKYQETLSKRQEIFKKIDNEAELNEKLIKDLRECVDQNGKVKKGYESRFDYIRKQLSSSSSPLQIEIDSQTEVVRLIDEQNNALDIQSEKITEIIKRNALRSKLESMQSDIEEKRRTLTEDYSLKIAKQREELAKYNDKRFKIYGFGELTPEQASKLQQELQRYRRIGFENLGVDDQKRFQELVAQQNPISEAASGYDVLVASISYMEDAMKRAQAEVNNYDAAFTALDGTMSDVEKASALLDRNLVLSDAGASFNGVMAEFNKLKDEYETMLKNDVDISDETKQYYENLFDVVGEDLKSFGDEGKQALEEAGFTTGKSYIQKIRDGISAELKAEEKAAKDMKTFLKETYVDMGESDIEGIIEGIKRKHGSLVKALEEEGYAGLAAYANAVDSHSPSKKFEQLGAYDMLGLINGITKKEGALDKAFSAAAASNMAAYTAAMTANSSSFAFTPMINPSGIQNGTAAIQSQLNGLSTTPLGATLTSQLAASVDTSQIDSDNSKILRALADLLGGVGDLGTRMENLQIVMDTGATVGALAPGMDLELGRRAVRKSRGV